MLHVYKMNGIVKIYAGDRQESPNALRTDRVICHSSLWYPDDPCPNIASSNEFQVFRLQSKNFLFITFIFLCILFVVFENIPVQFFLP